MLASVRVRVTHLLLRVVSRARECSLASAFWHASVSRVSRERLARFVTCTFLVSGTVPEQYSEYDQSTVERSICNLNLKIAKK